MDADDRKDVRDFKPGKHGKRVSLTKKHFGGGKDIL
jgi:hypothetical protein